MKIEIGKANLEIFSQTLVELGKKDKNLMVVTSDSRGSGKLMPFADALPEQIIEIGIAEQNLVGVSVGLASTGKKVFAVSPACFLTSRALEQIKNDVAYSDNPVKLVGISAGVSYGALGSTHHSLHDIAALRAIHNTEIIVPADNFETYEAVKYAADSNHPVYLRLGKRAMENLYTDFDYFEVGKANILKEGYDVAFIATGETVIQSMYAAEYLEQKNITTRVISMHRLKPIDDAAIISAARECKVIITVEEHSVNGGLGEATASLLMQIGIKIPFKIIGIPDEYTVTGSQMEIFEHYGISAQSLSQTALELLT
jgi:transketolase